MLNRHTQERFVIVIRFVFLSLLGLVALAACAAEEQPGDVCAAPATLDAVFQIALGPRPILPGLGEGRDEDVLAAARTVFSERFSQITLASIDDATDRVTCEGFFQSDVIQRPTVLAYDVSPNLSGGAPVVRVLSHQSELNLVTGTLGRALETSRDDASVQTPDFARPVPEAVQPPSLPASGTGDEAEYEWWNVENRGYQVLVAPDSVRSSPHFFIFRDGVHTEHRIEFFAKLDACADSESRWRDLPDGQWRSYSLDFGADHPARIADEMDCYPRWGSTLAGTFEQAVEQAANRTPEP